MKVRMLMCAMVLAAGTVFGVMPGANVLEVDYSSTATGVFATLTSASASRESFDATAPGIMYVHEGTQPAMNGGATACRMTLGNCSVIGAGREATLVEEMWVHPETPAAVSVRNMTIGDFAAVNFTTLTVEGCSIKGDVEIGAGDEVDDAWVIFRNCTFGDVVWIYNGDDAVELWARFENCRFIGSSTGAVKAENLLYGEGGRNWLELAGCVFDGEFGYAVRLMDSSARLTRCTALGTTLLAQSLSEDAESAVVVDNTVMICPSVSAGIDLVCGLDDPPLYGSGAALTDLDASELGSGNVPWARMPTGSGTWTTAGTISGATLSGYYVAPVGDYSSSMPQIPGLIWFDTRSGELVIGRDDDYPAGWFGVASGTYLYEW